MLKKVMFDQSTRVKEEVGMLLSPSGAILLVSAIVQGTACRFCELVRVWLHIVFAMQRERYSRSSLSMSALEIMNLRMSAVEIMKVRCENALDTPGWRKTDCDYSSMMDEENDFKKVWEDSVWSNVTQYKSISVEPLPQGQIVQLKGDFTFIDPFKLFFKSIRSASCLSDLQSGLRHLQQLGHYDFTVTYKGHISYFLSSRSWDADTAFEISRQGRSLGCAELPSRFIGIIPRRLVDLLRNENADDDEDVQLHEDDGVSVVSADGVCVGHVNGKLIRSGDGDFVISGPKDACPPRKISRWIEDDCVQHADILCATGGMWTFCDDSSDEEDEDECMSTLEDDF